MILFWRLRSSRQPFRPVPPKRKIRVWFKAEFGVPGKQLVAQNPIGIVNVRFVVIRHVVIFDDAPDLHVGKRERLRQVFEALGFYDRLFVNLAIKLRDRTVSANRAGFDA